ncbi:MAG: hypothetical protein ABSA53_38380, partial [Streptosporangiaceae bacterium]
RSMSYDSSQYQPPAQGRWPNATPAEAWPSYRDDDVHQSGARLDGQYGADRQGAYPATAGYQRQIGYQRASGDSGDRGYPSTVATDTFPTARSGYASADGYGARRDGYAWDERGGAANGYADADTRNGYGAANGYVAAPRSGYAPVGYAGGDDSFDGAGGYGYGGSQNGYANTVSGYAPVADGYAPAADGYAPVADGYATAADGYAPVADGYAPVADGYAGSTDGYDWNGYGYGTVTDGFDGAQDGFAAPGGYVGQGDYVAAGGYAERGGYREPASAEAGFGAPDAGLDPAGWWAERDRRRAAGQRGLAVGAVTGLLAVAVATGVSTLVAAFVRPQGAPAIAVGDVFIDRVPAGLRNAAMAHGSHGRIALLLVMYLAIGCVALVMGVLSRRAAALGVASLAAFTMVSAFVTVTRPGGRAADVIPAIVGGVAGVVALLWLQRASAPVTAYPPTRRAADRDAPDGGTPDRGGSRRRTR